MVLSSLQVDRIKAAVRQNDRDSLREILVALLDAPWSNTTLRALDEAGLLTAIIPELEAARSVDQPHVHFLPVLAHSIEAVAAVDWLFYELGAPTAAAPPERSAQPVAVQTHPDLRFRSAYAARLRDHFSHAPGDTHSRPALFKLAALLHDVAKPQTKRLKPEGGVSFYEHQTIGASIAHTVAERLQFDASEAEYIAVIVREHMRPGQLTDLEQVTLRAVQRFFRATEDRGPDVLLHSLADHMATRGPMLNELGWYRHVAWTDDLLDVIWGEQEQPEAALIDGHQLMAALQITPGPVVGDLLAAIGEAQASGEISTPEEALELAQRLFRRRQ